MSIGNTTPSENTKQRFFLAPPLKRKLPQDCFLSFIDQGTDELTEITNDFIKGNKDEMDDK